jgi:PAS domain S-box-containing protein
VGGGDATRAALPEDALLRSLFELLPAGVLVLDARGLLAWWNPAAQGTWPDPLVAGTELLLPPRTAWGSGGEVLASDWAGHRASRSGERVIGQALWMQDGNGSQRLVVHSAVPVPAPGGAAPAGAVVLLQDVTELKAVEGQLEALLASMGEALVCVDGRLRITRVNRAAEALFGHPASRLEGADVSVLLEPGGRPDARAALAAAPPLPHATRLPGCWRRAGGEPLQLEATASAFRWDGQVLRTVLLRDISARLRADSTRRLLAEASELLSSTLDERSAAQDVTRVATSVGHADVALLHVRREDGRFERLALSAAAGIPVPGIDARLGGPLEEDGLLLAPSLYRDGEPLLLPRLDGADLAARVPSARLRAGLQRLGIRSLLALPLKARGRTRGGLVLLRAKGRYVPADLAWGRLLATRAALALDNAALFEAAQVAGRERAALLGVVAHELRNPLSTVRMAAGLVRRALPDRPEVAARAAESSERAAVRADGILQALLDGARADAGKLEVRCAPLVVEALLPEIRALGDGLASEARWEVRSPPALPRVQGDATRLMQVLGNLLGNAFRHSPRGGTVSLEISPAAGGLEFRVRDEGPGLSEADWEHLFERGWQGGGHGGGLGLGLYLSRVLVEAQGGAIWAERPAGGGAVFGFRLPLAPP